MESINGVEEMKETIQNEKSCWSKSRLKRHMANIKTKKPREINPRTIRELKVEDMIEQTSQLKKEEPQMFHDQSGKFNSEEIANSDIISILRIFDQEETEKLFRTGMKTSTYSCFNPLFVVVRCSDAIRS